MNLGNRKPEWVDDADPNFNSTGPGQGLEDELEQARIESEQYYLLLDDVHQLLTSMIQADDLPDEEAHENRLEELANEIRETIAA
jgi:hypothetical protein